MKKLNDNEKRAISAAKASILEAVNILDETIEPIFRDYHTGSAISNFSYRAECLARDIEERFPE